MINLRLNRVGLHGRFVVVIPPFSPFSSLILGFNSFFFVLSLFLHRQRLTLTEDNMDIKRQKGICGCTTLTGDGWVESGGLIFLDKPLLGIFSIALVHFHKKSCLSSKTLCSCNLLLLSTFRSIFSLVLGANCSLFLS